MMKKILTTILLILTFTIGFCQDENVLYIVDTVPIIDEPKEGFGTLNENEIDRVEVVKDKKAIEQTGYKDVDGIIYVYTKEYANRPDSIKSIPTTHLMTRKNGFWYLKDQTIPYSGYFIDYYLNGKKQGEGNLLNGKLKGKRTLYDLNGQISDIVYYENGVPNGTEERFYKDGTLMQKGEFENGKEIGIWEMYHPNGQLKQRSNFVNGKMDGESFSYYSTGEIKGENLYKNGDYQPDKLNDELFELYNESQNLYKQNNLKAAIKKLDKALQLNPNWSDGYFARATMKLNDFQFDEAIADFDKTLEIEPYYTNAYANRAFAIIRKFEFGESQTLSKSKDIQIFASKDFEIPTTELSKICADLNKSIQLGDENWMVMDALENYCK